MPDILISILKFTLYISMFLRYLSHHHHHHHILITTSSSSEHILCTRHYANCFTKMSSFKSLSYPWEVSGILLLRLHRPLSLEMFKDLLCALWLIHESKFRVLVSAPGIAQSMSLSSTLCFSWLFLKDNKY